MNSHFNNPFQKKAFLADRFNVMHLAIMVVLLFFSGLQFLQAVPAYPNPIEFRQPDGTTITIRMMGDEKINWAETLDGYSILVNKEGFYEYAILDEHGDMVFSGIHVSPQEQRSSKELDFLQDIPQGLRFSERQKEMMLSVWELRSDAANRSFPTTGERTLLCILMETTDVPFTKTQADFDALFNQLNYTIGGATGSVRDYYLENSYGQLDLTVDVVGPYTAQHNMAHYGSTWAGARQLATEAVHLANPDVNFADYDNTGDGWVEGFYMIFSGYGEEAGGGPNTIWSHAWNIDPVQFDGTWISRYACSPELRGNSGTNITRIGVIGHEFGHVLGAPDYYDTGGNGYTGTGSWDMMAGGTWNGGGATPAHHNAYTKVYLYNWAEATILNQPGSLTLQNAVEYDNSFYRINTNTPGEYYLLENRHQIGFDAQIPGEGMIIYHVHQEVATSGNSINVGHPQKMYPVCAGANFNPSGPPWSYGNINSNMTPFPGSNNQTYFSDHSTPNMISWAGEETNKPLTNITRSAATQTVSFDFLEEIGNITDWMHWDDGMHQTSVGVNSGGIYQIAARFDPDDLIHYIGFEISAIRVYVANPPTTAAIKVWQGAGQNSLVELRHQEFSPPSSNWIAVELDTPIMIDPELELWFGAEYDDPGQNVFPASADIHTNHDGKGNMIRMDTDDPESWVALSEFNISGDWNLQAIVMLREHHQVTFEVSGGNGSITAHADGEEIESGDLITDVEELLFTALPDTGYTIKQWTINEEVMDDTQENTLILEHVDSDLHVTVDFEAVYHYVHFETADGNGTLIAEVNDEQINNGDEVQEGSAIMFTAIPNQDYVTDQWIINGTIVEGHTDDTYLINYLEEDAEVVVVFTFATGIYDDDSLTIQIYPNPASNLLNISSPVQLTKLKLLDIRGRVLHKQKLNGNHASLNVSGIDAGTYIIHMESDYGETTRRVQISK